MLPAPSVRRHSQPLILMDDDDNVLGTPPKQGLGSQGQRADSNGNMVVKAATLACTSENQQDLAGLQSFNFTGQDPCGTSTATPQPNISHSSAALVGDMSAPGFDGDGDVLMADLEDMSAIMNVMQHIQRERFISAPKAQHEQTYKPSAIQNRIPDPCFLMVVDTSFILSHLHLIEAMVNLHDAYRSVIVMPWATVQELDGLRKSSGRIIATSSAGLAGSRHAGGPSREVEVAKLARQAVNWQFKMFQMMHKGVWGQKKEECLEVHDIGDDAILDCCRYFHEKMGLPIVLLSDDRNLCVKANIYQLLTVSFEPGVTYTAKAILEKATEKCGRTASPAESRSRQSQLSASASPFQPLQISTNIVVDDDAHMTDAPTPSPISPVNSSRQLQNLTSSRHVSGLYSPVSPFRDSPNLQQTTITLGDLLSRVHKDVMSAVPELMHIYAIKAFDGEEAVKYLRINFRSIRDFEGIESEITKHWMTLFSHCMPLDIKAKAKTHELSRQYHNWIAWIDGNNAQGKPQITILTRWLHAWTTIWKNLYNAVQESDNIKVLEARLNSSKSDMWMTMMEGLRL